MDEQKRAVTLAVAERIRYFRHIKAKSQEEVALAASLNPAYYGQVERGLKCPTVDTLYKIAKALDIPLPELLRFPTVLNLTSESEQRVKDALNHIPPDKIDQVLRIIEEVGKLF